MVKTTVLLCDLDGCLVDTQALITASMQHTFSAVLGSAVTAAQVNAWLGEPLKVTFARAVGPHCEDGAALVERCIAAYRLHNGQHHDALIRRVPGMAEALARCAAGGVKLAVVTSKLRATALQGLRACGLAGLFEVCVGLDDCEEHKPHPAPALRALALLGEAPGPHVAFVGDAPTDVLCGHAAGCGMSIAVGWSALERARLEAAQPTHWVSTAAELASLVLGEGGASASASASSASGGAAPALAPAPAPAPAPQQAQAQAAQEAALWARLEQCSRRVEEEEQGGAPGAGAALLRRHECAGALGELLPHLASLPSAPLRSAAHLRLQALLQGALSRGSAAGVLAEETLLCCARLMGDAVAAPLALRGFVSWLGAGGVGVLLQGGSGGSSGSAESGGAEDAAWPALLQALVSVPDRAARGLFSSSSGGAAAAPLPAILTPATYFSLLEMELCRAALSAAPLPAAAQGAAAPTWRRHLSLLQRLCALGRGKSLGGSWVTAQGMQAPAAAAAAAGPATLLAAALRSPSAQPAHCLALFEGAVLAVGSAVLEECAAAVGAAVCAAVRAAEGAPAGSPPLPLPPLTFDAAGQAYEAAFSEALAAAIAPAHALPPPTTAALLSTLLLSRALAPHLALGLARWGNVSAAAAAAGGHLGLAGLHFPH